MKLIRLMAKQGGDQTTDGRLGSQWRESADRILLLVRCWRPHLTTHQSGTAEHRVIDTMVNRSHRLRPANAAPQQPEIAIVDCTLPPSPATIGWRSRRRVTGTAREVQVATSVSGRLIIETGDPPAWQPQTIAPYIATADRREPPTDRPWPTATARSTET